MATVEAFVELPIGKVEVVTHPAERRAAIKRLDAHPDPAREAAAHKILANHGFGFDLFANKRLSKVKAILKWGKIRNEGEFKGISDFAGDTTHDVLLRDTADSLFAAYRLQGRAASGATRRRMAVRNKAAAPLGFSVDGSRVWASRCHA